MGQARKDKGSDKGMTRTRQIDICAIRDKTGPYAPDPVNHQMWFRLSSANLCDDGLLIETEAWAPHMDRFMSNPVVGDSHSYAPVVERLLGKIVDWDTDQGGLLGLVEFAVGTPNGQWADYLAFNEFLNAGSVGFEIVRSGQDETEDGRKFTRVTEAKLLEFSLVMLPMDEAALAEREDSAVLVRALHSITRPGWDEGSDDAEFIRYQIREMKEFDEDTIKTLSMDVKGKADVQVVRGKLKDGDDEMHAQSIRFAKGEWTLDAAKKWWSEHKEDIRHMVFMGFARAWQRDDGGWSYAWQPGISSVHAELRSYNPDRARIAEVLDELKAIRIRLDGLIMAQPPVDAVSRTAIPVRDKDGFHLSPEDQALADVYRDLSGQALLHKVQQDLESVT